MYSGVCTSPLYAPSKKFVIHPGRHETAYGNVSCFVYRMRSYNQLLRTIHSSLMDVARGIKGLVVITTELEEVLSQFLFIFKPIISYVCSKLMSQHTRSYLATYSKRITLIEWDGELELKVQKSISKISMFEVLDRLLFQKYWLSDKFQMCIWKIWSESDRRASQEHKIKKFSNFMHKIQFTMVKQQIHQSQNDTKTKLIIGPRAGTRIVVRDELWVSMVKL